MTNYLPNTRVVIVVLSKNGILKNHEEYRDPKLIFKAIECFISRKSQIVSIESKVFKDTMDKNNDFINIYLTVSNNWDAVRFTEKRYGKQIKDMSVIRTLNSPTLKVDKDTIDVLSEIVSSASRYDDNNKIWVNATRIL